MAWATGSRSCDSYRKLENPRRKPAAPGLMPRKASPGPPQPPPASRTPAARANEASGFSSGR